MKPLRVVKLQVVERKDRSKPKVIVNLPADVLEYHKKGDAFTVYVDENYIVLSRNGDVPQAGPSELEVALREFFDIILGDKDVARAIKRLAKRDPRVGELIQRIVSLM